MISVLEVELIVEQSRTKRLTVSYHTQEILASTMSQLLEEGVKKLEEAVFKTEKEMERELCQAVRSHTEHLS